MVQKTPYRTEIAQNLAARYHARDYALATDTEVGFEDGMHKRVRDQRI